MHRLANYYEAGYGCAQDFQLMGVWMLLAAQYGHVPSQTQMGCIHRNGQLGVQDIAQSIYPYVDENVHDIKQFGMTMEFVLLLSGALVSSPNTQDIVSGTAIYSVFSTTNNSSVTGTVLTVLVILTFVTYGILFFC